MDQKQIASLLEDLPFLSSRITFEVAQEAVDKYIENYYQETDREQARDKRYANAILKSKWRRQDQPPSGRKGSHGEPLNWGWVSQSFWKDECRKVGLKPKSEGVTVGKDGRWYVSGWVPRKDWLDRYEPQFREALPLPEDDGYTECGRTDDEWLVIFWAMVELNPEYQKRSPAPPPSDGRFKDSADIRGFARSLKQRTPISHLVNWLKSSQDTEIHRFEAGRKVVIEVLFRECSRRSSQRAHDGETKSRFDLVGGGDGSELPKPKFLPAGWKSLYWPKTDTVPAVGQWLACALQMLEHWQESMSATEDANDIVSISMARQAGDDAWRLARHLRDQHKIKPIPKKPADSSRLANVTAFLDEVGQAISKAPVVVASHKPPRRESQARPRGVTLLTAALLLQGLNDDDQTDKERRATAKEMKAKWQKRRTVTLPPPIGFAPLPDSPQTHLYLVGDLSDCVSAVESHLVTQFGGQKKFSAALKKLEREPLSAAP